jgi:hypothetical protein
MFIYIYIVFSYLCILEKSIKKTLCLNALTLIELESGMPVKYLGPLNIDLIFLRS